MGQINYYFLQCGPCLYSYVASRVVYRHGVVYFWEFLDADVLL